MKVFLVFFVVLSLTFASLFAWAESNYQRQNSEADTKITLLQNQLNSIYQQDTNVELDWKNELRLKRAIHYLRTSKQYRDANWDKQAKEQAQRGLNLVTLFRQNV
ncbi:hypothetical protein [Aliiglaciecola litoralis]|uniref:Uncharacterized protein n=1 Tax=Aliiglaciecola litoralis TaxID=582857 RepID=A0ABP3WQK9_9ALTE